MLTGNLLWEGYTDKTLGDCFVIMQADRFTGPYEYVKSLKPEGFGVGDFDMWSDPKTGQGYVWFERPHCELICAELTPDYLGTNG